MPSSSYCSPSSPSWKPSCFVPLYHLDVSHLGAFVFLALSGCVSSLWAPSGQCLGQEPRLSLTLTQSLEWKRHFVMSLERKLKMQPRTLGETFRLRFRAWCFHDAWTCLLSNFYFNSQTDSGIAWVEGKFVLTQYNHFAFWMYSWISEGSCPHTGRPICDMYRSSFQDGCN